MPGPQTERRPDETAAAGKTDGDYRPSEVSSTEATDAVAVASEDRPSTSVGRDSIRPTEGECEPTPEGASPAETAVELEDPGNAASADHSAPVAEEPPPREPDDADGAALSEQLGAELDELGAEETSMDRGDEVGEDELGAWTTDREQKSDEPVKSEDVNADRDWADLDYSLDAGPDLGEAIELE